MIEDAQLQPIIELLRADLDATVAVDCDGLALQEASRVHRFVRNADAFVDRAVAQVQQRLHDEFIDTTWPACPEHPNHPLWFADGSWRCEQSGTRIAELGQLPRRR